MTDDAAAVSGDAGGYVPCDELAAVQVLLDSDGYAIAGEGEGRVPVDQSAGGAGSLGDDSAAVYGSSVGYVAKPCLPDVVCHEARDYTDRDAATSWRPVGSIGTLSSGLVRTAQVADGSPPSGSATELATSGPFWENPPNSPDLRGMVIPRWLHDGFPGDPWTLTEFALTNHISWATVPGRAFVRIQGDINVALAWTGTGFEAEAEAIAPALEWELCLSDYGTLNVATSAFEEPAAGTYDDVALVGHGYTATVIATGIDIIGSHPLDVTIAAPSDYVQLFLRVADDQAETVVLFNHPFETPLLVAGVMPRFPGYVSTTYRTLGGATGMQVYISDFSLSFCD